MSTIEPSLPEIVFLFINHIRNKLLGKDSGYFVHQAIGTFKIKILSVINSPLIILLFLAIRSYVCIVV